MNDLTSRLQLPGRHCPTRYRYGARAIANAPLRATTTRYVVGGLYGNTAALQSVLKMANSESVAPELCFNGDFNWLNVDHESFRVINTMVLAHDAILGNFEAALGRGAGPRRA